MKYYSKDKLLTVAKDRGYTSLRAIADALVPIFDKKSKTIQGNLSFGNLTKEECEVIGSYFEMTMKEYYDVFMNGLFQEDMNGHFVCHVDQMYQHLHPNFGAEMDRKQYENLESGRRKNNAKRKLKTATEVLSELENL